MSPWLGVTFNEDFGSELGDGSWHHLGIAINENGMLSATLDAITIDDAVEVVSPPAGIMNNDPNINFPQMNCDGFENIMHVSAERVVDRDTFVGKIEEVKENTNGTLTFKHSLPPSLTWGFYETVIVGVNSNTLNYGECRVQLVITTCVQQLDQTTPRVKSVLQVQTPCVISLSGDPSKTITAIGGGETSVLDALRIIILLEKDLSMQEIASASLLEDTVEISMEEVCGDGYALVMSDNPRACVPCGPGWKFDNETKECVLCDYGHYQNGIAQTECIPCGNDKWTNFRGARDENDCIITCEAGTYYDVDEEQCMDCKRHYFQNMTGQDYCFPCPLGYKTVGNRSTSIAACTEDCLPGYVRNPQNLTECVRCNRGTFRSTQDDCVPCTDGKYTLEDTIAMDSSNCDMDICDFGEFWNVSASNCQKCDFGYYQNEMYELQCKMCASDYSTRDMGAQNDSFCEFYCPFGEELKERTNCASCERGSFKDNVGLNKFNPCKECSTGKTTETAGSTSESNCSIHKCGPGEINTENGCVKCPIDTYQTIDHPYSSIECQLCQKDGIFETGTIAAGVSNSDECKHR
ncbi:SCUB1-like protein [Mya arenaria]|uniref:SCUB1-like protein n=1 Tax=Mya arenaria TaxID=6604 RepID=A0ABY7DES6_MYAAR|nr:SCUB1-like protein [Mya arenaria]